MSDQNFTAIEAVTRRSLRQGVAVMWRFITGLPSVRYTVLPVLCFMLLASAIPPFFLWLIGQFYSCDLQTSRTHGCSVQILDLFSINVTFQFLGIIALCAALARFSCWVFFEIPGQWSAQALHTRLIAGLARTRTTYFDQHPSGRIINRITSDFGSLRDSGLIAVGDSMNAMIDVACIMVLVTLAHPVGTILALPTLCLFFYTQYYLSLMAQHARAMKGARMGEVIHRLTDLIDGGAIFERYGQLEKLQQRLGRAVRRMLEMSVFKENLDAWGRFWMTAITTSYLFTGFVFVTVAMHQESISIALGAVIMTALMQLAPSFGWLAYSTGELNESVAHAQRVFEIVDLPDEVSQERRDARVVDTARLPTEPLAIEFRNFAMSYRQDTTPIFTDLSLTIPAGKSVGIVGRTGSGKTSLMQSLFRMVYVRGGQIAIGGTSIHDAPIDSVRALFGVVPQDPYLFEGTVRTNLDRDCTIAPERLQAVCARVGFPYPIDNEVHEGGKNFSVGERQLLCLARIMLHNHPYLIMDEPTSSVDTITDTKIQRWIMMDNG